MSSFDRAELMAEEIDTKYWGNWPLVIDKATEAINVDRTCAWPYAQRGTAYREVGRYEEAMKDFDRAIALQPDFEPAYTDRGLLLLLMNRLDEAEIDLRTALRLDPNEPSTMAAMAEVLAIQGNTWDACAYLKGAASNGYDSLGLMENNRNFDVMSATGCAREIARDIQKQKGPAQKPSPPARIFP